MSINWPDTGETVTLELRSNVGGVDTNVCITLHGGMYTWMDIVEKSVVPALRALGYILPDSERIVEALDNWPEETQPDCQCVDGCQGD